MFYKMLQAINLANKMLNDALGRSHGDKRYTTIA